MERETCWTLIRSASGGNAEARSVFGRRYLPVVHAYLAARWAGTPFDPEIDDAVQDVFVECFQSNGVMQRADPKRRFHAFLLGVARNIAGRIERALARRSKNLPPGSVPPENVQADETRLSQVFDRAFARTVMQHAARVHEKRARAKGEQALRRFEILQLRFREDLPIREIADRFGLAADLAHHEYAQARKEFKDALRSVVAEHYPEESERLDEKCASLVRLLR